MFLDSKVAHEWLMIVLCTSYTHMLSSTKTLCGLSMDLLLFFRLKHAKVSVMQVWSSYIYVRNPDCKTTSFLSTLIWVQKWWPRRHVFSVIVPGYNISPKYQRPPRYLQIGDKKQWKLQTFHLLKASPIFSNYKTLHTCCQSKIGTKQIHVCSSDQCQHKLSICVPCPRRYM